jgi:thiamine pyrophosphate-dependent acetolactate synthase large subunit-like protein
MGGDGETVAEPAEIGAAARRALEAGGPYLLDLRIDKAYPTPVAPWRAAVKAWEDAI